MVEDLPKFKTLLLAKSMLMIWQEDFLYTFHKTSNNAISQNILILKPIQDIKINSIKHRLMVQSS